MTIYQKDTPAKSNYEVFVRSEDDFPTPINGKIYLENRVYVIDAIVTHSRTLVFPSTGGCILTSPIFGGHTSLIYIGTGIQFEGNLTATSIIELRHLEVSAGAGTLFSVSGPGGLGVPSGVLSVTDTNVIGAASGGTITDVTFIMRFGALIGLAQGFSFIGNGTTLVSILDQTVYNWLNQPGTIMFSFSGFMAVIEIEGCRFQNNPNEFVFKFSSASLVTLTVGKVNRCFFVQPENTFAAGSWDQTNTNLWFDSNDGVNSHTYGIMMINGNTIDTEVAVKGDEGDVLSFAASGANPTTHTTVTTDGAHGLSNDDIVVLVCRAGDTCDTYDGTHIISNVTATTFDIEIVYMDTGLAHWETGWTIILGDTFTNDFNERFSLSEDNILTAGNRLFIDSAGAEMTMSASQSVAANKIVQFGIFHDGKRLSKSQLDVTSSEKSTSSHPATSILSGCYYEVRLRNMSDTTNILVSNGQLRVKL